MLDVAIAGPFPLARDEFRGGVEAITYRLAEGLNEDTRIRLHVVTLTEDHARCGVEEWNGYRVTRIPASARFGNLNFGIPDRKQIVLAVRRLAPQIVHAHSLGVYALGAIESGAPTLISIHGVIGKEIALERGIKNRIRYVPRMYVVNKSLALGRDFVIVSPYIESEYARELRGKRTRSLETSVDPRFFEVSPNEEGLTVLMAGPLIPRKGAVDLLRAAPQIVAAHSHVRFVFAGGATNAAYKAELDRVVRSMSLGPRVAFLGRLAPEALAAEMAKCACVVLPSLQETAPIAIQEAMAAARPVVASSVGGLPYLVEDGKTGFIVPPRDVNALAARVIEVLADPARRSAMGQRAREQARERFDMRLVAQRTVAIYDEVLASIRKAAG